MCEIFVRFVSVNANAQTLTSVVGGINGRSSETCCGRLPQSAANNERMLKPRTSGLGGSYGYSSPEILWASPCECGQFSPYTQTTHKWCGGNCDEFSPMVLRASPFLRVRAVRNERTNHLRVDRGETTAIFPRSFVGSSLRVRPVPSECSNQVQV